MFKQRYYRKINILNLCWQVLLSGNFQSQNFAAGNVFKQTILSEPSHLKAP